MSNIHSPDIVAKPVGETIGVDVAVGCGDDIGMLKPIDLILSAKDCSSY